MDRRPNEIEVSLEEKRFLRRFVRRELGPWLAGVAALAGLALVAALLAPPSRLTDPAPDAGRALTESSGLDATSLAGLRAENARLRADLTALERAIKAELTALERAVAAARSLPAAGVDGAEASELEARLREAFEARVSRLESALETRSTSVSREVVGDSREVVGDSAPVLLGDLNAIRERLFNLEMRQDRKDQERAALQQDVLARLYELERASQTEAAARIANLETGEQRLEKLELRVGAIEHQRAPASAPAAPASSP
jgi:hypothetical protein